MGNTPRRRATPRRWVLGVEVSARGRQARPWAGRRRSNHRRVQLARRARPPSRRVPIPPALLRTGPGLPRPDTGRPAASPSIPLATGDDPPPPSKASGRFSAAPDHRPMGRRGSPQAQVNTAATCWGFAGGSERVRAGRSPASVGRRSTGNQPDALRPLGGLDPPALWRTARTSVMPRGLRCVPTPPATPGSKAWWPNTADRLPAG